MNDFLQSLRNGTIKRQDRHRKQFDNPQYRNNDRSGNRDKRSNPRKSHGGVDFGEIKKLLQSLNDNAELSRIAQERTAEAMERIARSLQVMARDDLMAPETGAAADPVAAAPAPPQDPPADADDSELDNEALRDRVAAIVRDMRQAGNSFEAIARHLNSQSLPTLSGKGSWRAQNVSRVYNAARHKD